MTESPAESRPVEKRQRNYGFPLLLLFVLLVLLTCYFLVPVLYWLLVAPVILLLLGAQIHRPLNMNRVAFMLALLAFAAPGFCLYIPYVLILFGTFGEFYIPLTSGLTYVQSAPEIGIIAFIFVTVPQLVFTGQLGGSTEAPQRGKGPMYSESYVWFHRVCYY